MRQACLRGQGCKLNAYGDHWGGGASLRPQCFSKETPV